PRQRLRGARDTRSRVVRAREGHAWGDWPGPPSRDRARNRRTLDGGDAAEHLAREAFVGDERPAPLGGRLHPVDTLWQHDAARTRAVQRGVLSAWRQRAIVAQGARGVDQASPGANDHRVTGAQVLFPALVDRPHALGDGLVLQEDTGDARVALHRALRLT